MRINEANIFLFIAAVIIGVLIAMNISIDGQAKFLDVEQYRKAYDERTRLQSEVSALQEKTDELEYKIDKFESTEKTSFEVIQEMSNELENNKLILGLTPVVGDGVKITLNDSPLIEGGSNFTSEMLIHDTDIAKVLNDLRNAGAEAITLNGYRLSFTSYDVCFGATIKVDGVKIGAPFSIVAIGNREGIKTYMDTQQNHINNLKARGCYVKIENVYDTKLPAYTGGLSSKYMLEK